MNPRKILDRTTKATLRPWASIKQICLWKHEGSMKKHGFQFIRDTRTPRTPLHTICQLTIGDLRGNHTNMITVIQRDDIATLGDAPIPRSTGAPSTPFSSSHWPLMAPLFQLSVINLRRIKPIVTDTGIVNPLQSYRKPTVSLCKWSGPDNLPADRWTDLVTGHINNLLYLLRRHLSKAMIKMSIYKCHKMIWTIPNSRYSYSDILNTGVIPVNLQLWGKLHIVWRGW